MRNPFKILTFPGVFIATIVWLLIKALGLADPEESEDQD
jgi:hypothetical protein